MPFFTEDDMTEFCDWRKISGETSQVIQTPNIHQSPVSKTKLPGMGRIYPAQGKGKIDPNQKRKLESVRRSSPGESSPKLSTEGVARIDPSSRRPTARTAVSELGRPMATLSAPEGQAIRFKPKRQEMAPCPAQRNLASMDNTG